MDFADVIKDFEMGEINPNYPGGTQCNHSSLSREGQRQRRRCDNGSPGPGNVRKGHGPRNEDNSRS